MWHGWGRVVAATSRRVSEADKDAFGMEKITQTVVRRWSVVLVVSNSTRRDLADEDV